MAGQYGDRNEPSDEEDVKDDRSEGEEADASKAACKDHSGDGVHNRDAGNALDSLLPSGDAPVAIGLDREEVGVNAWWEVSYVYVDESRQASAYRE